MDKFSTLIAAALLAGAMTAASAQTAATPAAPAQPAAAAAPAAKPADAAPAKPMRKAVHKTSHRKTKGKSAQAAKKPASAPQ
jgi:hypothetical protein